MGTVTVTTNYAAPFIRYNLIHAVGRAEDATTKRDRLAGYREAHAYAQALEILQDAESTKDEPVGIADFDSIPKKYVDTAKAWLKERWVSLGFESAEDAEDAEFGAQNQAQVDIYNSTYGPNYLSQVIEPF